MAPWHWVLALHWLAFYCDAVSFRRTEETLGNSRTYDAAIAGRSAADTDPSAAGQETAAAASAGNSGNSAADDETTTETTTAETAATTTTTTTTTTAAAAAATTTTTQWRLTLAQNYTLQLIYREQDSLFQRLAAVSAALNSTAARVKLALGAIGGDETSMDVLETQTDLRLQTSLMNAKSIDNVRAGLEEVNATLTPWAARVSAVNDSVMGALAGQHEELAYLGAAYTGMSSEAMETETADLERIVDEDIRTMKLAKPRLEAIRTRIFDLRVRLYHGNFTRVVDAAVTKEMSNIMEDTSRSAAKLLDEMT